MNRMNRMSSMSEKIKCNKSGDLNVIYQGILIRISLPETDIERMLSTNQLYSLNIIHTLFHSYALLYDALARLI